MSACVLFITRWLPGFARVPYYAPGQCPHQDTSLEVSLPPLLNCSLAPSLPRSIPPPLASSLPSFPRAIHASIHPFLARSLQQPSLPRPSLPPLTFSPCLSLPFPPSLPLSLPLPLPPSPSLPPLPPSCSLVPTLPLTLPLLPPSHPPSFLAPSMLPSLPPPSLPHYPPPLPPFWRLFLSIYTSWCWLLSWPFALLSPIRLSCHVHLNPDETRSETGLLVWLDISTCICESMHFWCQM